MADAAREYTATDEERPFENFQEVVKNLLRVSKKEVDGVVHSHQKQGKQEKPKRED